MCLTLSCQWSIYRPPCFQTIKCCKNIWRHPKVFIFSPENQGGLWWLNNTNLTSKLLFIFSACKYKIHFQFCYLMTTGMNGLTVILELWQQVNGKKLAITTTYNFLQFLWAFVLTFLIWYNLHKGYKLWRGVAWFMKLISVKCAHHEHSQHNVGDNGYHPGLLCIPGHPSSQLETCHHKSK